jgi:hypothetical protein
LEVPTSEILKNMDFQLLSDDAGVYGFGFRSESQNLKENWGDFASEIILRADLIEPVYFIQHGDFVFLPLDEFDPFEWVDNNVSLESIFVKIQAAVIGVRNGLSGNCLNFLFDGTQPEAWEAFPREYEAYELEAFAHVEEVIRRAYASCVPSHVMPVLGQLKQEIRYQAYTHMVGSPRFNQLLSVFPALGIKIMNGEPRQDLPNGTAERAKKMVEEGCKLGDIAKVMKVASALRRIRIQDAEHSYALNSHFCNYNSHLRDFWDQNAGNLLAWFNDINFAHTGAGPEFAAWVACNHHECSSNFNVFSIGDWVRTSLEGTGIYPVARPFEKTMSPRTVERLSDEWHRNVEGIYNEILGIDRPHNWAGCPEADGCETEEEYVNLIRKKVAAKILPKAWISDAEINGIFIKAVTNELELIEASLHLRNCGGTYSELLHRGECCIYTASRGIEILAMIEVQRQPKGYYVTQCAGYLNQTASTEVLDAVENWESSFPTSPEPTWEEIYTSDNWEFEIGPPAFNE